MAVARFVNDERLDPAVAQFQGRRCYSGFFHRKRPGAVQVCCRPVTIYVKLNAFTPNVYSFAAKLCRFAVNKLRFAAERYALGTEAQSSGTNRFPFVTTRRAFVANGLPSMPKWNRDGVNVLALIPKLLPKIANGFSSGANLHTPSAEHVGQALAPNGRS